MISIWEKESLLKYDFVIVGSGIVGLQTAIQLKEKFPKRSVLILERGLLPTGASTRNAGFAATGSLSELVADSQYESEQEIFDLFSSRKAGLDFLRNQLGDEAIGFENNGSFELLEASEVDILDHMDHYNNLLKSLNNQQAIFKMNHDKLKEFGFSINKFKYCLNNNTEAALNTGKLMRSLNLLALNKGVQIITGAELISYNDLGNKIELLVNDSFRKENLIFTTEKMVICTNAFSKTFFPDEDMQPGRGQIILTKPIENLPFKGIFHFGAGYYYFRNLGNRVLFGGGRNIAFEEETTTELKLNQNIIAHLKSLLKEQILPHLEFEIEMEWSGIMAFGKSKTPIISSINERIIGGFRLGGMGVALGSILACQIVDRID
ncbi:MAG TPA: FAD-dependent oxidoreductase [Edaphocola sp.]|nr:FAD-dependent oxidoreductase [Edaphocola sp.]